MTTAMNNRKFRVFFLGESRDDNNGHDLQDHELEQAVVFAFKNGYHEFYEDLCSIYKRPEKRRYCSDQLIARMAAIVKRRLEDSTKEFEETLNILEERKNYLLQINNASYYKELCRLVEKEDSILKKIGELIADCQFWEVI